MDRIVYTAMTGAARVLEQQSVISNNLANVSTAGFREQLSAYRSVPLVASEGLPTRVTTVASTPSSNFRQGGMLQTGRALDVAVTGPGWFSVQTPTGEAYTRGGELAVNARGQLVSPQGLPVLAANGAPVTVPDRGTLTFGADGAITVLGAGSDPKDIEVIGQLKLVNPPPASLERSGDGLFRMAPGQAPVAQADPAVRMVSGFVEKSNVSAAQAMVGMISNARDFEMQMKVIQDASTNEDKGNSILSVG